MSKEAIKTKFIICDLDGCLIKSGWIWDVVKEKGFSKDVAFDFLTVPLVATHAKLTFLYTNIFVSRRRAVYAYIF